MTTSTYWGRKKMSLNNTKEEQELYDDIVGGLIGEEPTTWSHDKVLEFMANLVDLGILTSRDLSYAHAYTASCSGSGGSIGDVFECDEDSAKALFAIHFYTKVMENTDAYNGVMVDWADTYDYSLKDDFTYFLFDEYYYFFAKTTWH